MLNKVKKTSKYQKIKQFLWDVLVNGFMSGYVIPDYVRKIMLRSLRIKIGENSSIKGHCYIGASTLTIGKNSYLNRGCFVNNTNAGTVFIGDNCSVGFNVTLLTTTHDYSNSQKRGGEVISKRIIINDGVWIGANVTICPGVEIGNGTIIAAGAIVTKDCKENSIYAGVPAKQIKKLL